MSGRKGSFESRLERLSARLKSVREQRNKDENEPQKRGTAIGMAFRLITELVAGLIVGGLLGWWLDKWLGTSPIFLLIFFALGAAAGILNVMRTAREMQNDGKE